MRAVRGHPGPAACVGPLAVDMITLQCRPSTRVYGVLYTKRGGSVQQRARQHHASTRATLAVAAALGLVLGLV